MRSLRAYWKPKPQTRAPDRPNKMTLDLTSLLIVNLNWTRLVGIGAREPQSPWARKVQNRYGNEKSNTEERIKGYLTGLDRTRRYNTAWMVVVMYHGSSRRWTRFVLSFRNDTFEIVLAIFLLLFPWSGPCCDKAVTLVTKTNRRYGNYEDTTDTESLGLVWFIRDANKLSEAHLVRWNLNTNWLQAVVIRPC